MIKAHEFLAKAAGTSKKKALQILKPSALLKLPESPPNLKYVKITGFHKPDNAIFFIALVKLLYLVVTSSCKMNKAVKAATDNAAFKNHITTVVR